MRRVSSYLSAMLFAFVAFIGLSLGTTNSAQAAVVAKISLSSQKMVVKVDGEVLHIWNVSTGKKGHITPRGTYNPKRMHKEYYSKKYNGAPMHHAIFFKGGYAVHATGATKALGRPASHGCIRLAPGNARALYALVKNYGPSRSKIVITG